MPDAGVTSGYAASFEPAMRLALEQAVRTDTGTSAGSDVPVGAVLLAPDGTVAGRGHNQCIAAADPTAHAEIVAIRQAAETTGSWRLDGCTLVVTLEPCTMCAGAALNARMRRLVYGAADPRAGAAGSLWDLVRDRRLGPPVEVIGGVLAEPCAALLTSFFERLRAE
jgi:tRNA(adenine34) deaminase